ncbi:MAG: hypothetical protein ACXW2G_08310 [Burkholderiaceae bacterium]
MNNTPVPPRHHTSILSPQFKYVPAACTNVAATFARVRAERLRAQADRGDDSQRCRAGTAELGVEVLEAVWLPRPLRSRATGNAEQARDGIHLTLLHCGADNG